MSVPLIGSGDSAVEEQLVAPLQGQQASPYVRSNIVLLRDLLISTNTSGSVVAATGASGSLRYLVIGNELFVTIDTYGLFALTVATCTEIQIRLPDGLVAGGFNALSGHNDTRVGIAPARIVSGGATVDGFLWLQGAFLYVVRDAAAAFAVGDIGVYGQVHGPIVQQGQFEG